MFNEKVGEFGLGHDRELRIGPSNIALPVRVLSRVRGCKAFQCPLFIRGH